MEVSIATLKERPLLFQVGEYEVEATHAIARTSCAGNRYFVLEMRVLDSTLPEIPVGAMVARVLSLQFALVPEQLDEITRAFPSKEIARCVERVIIGICRPDYWQNFSIEVSGRAHVTCRAVKTKAGRPLLKILFSPSRGKQ